ncbi:MAG TPA: hypothetical protein VGN26_04120 [Armatimonadota bacterium]|jgi:hypothetical protein
MSEQREPYTWPEGGAPEAPTDTAKPAGTRVDPRSFDHRWTRAKHAVVAAVKLGRGVEYAVLEGWRELLPYPGAREKIAAIIQTSNLLCETAEAALESSHKAASRKSRKAATLPLEVEA